MELFKNPHDALMFAMRFSSQQYAQTPMAKHLRRAAAEAGGGAGSAIGQGKGLVALDGAAQAGIIRSRMERLAPLQRACIVARFSERADACPCCGHDKPMEEYKAAILSLAQWADQYISSSSAGAGQRLRFAIIQEFYERKKSIGQAALSLGVPKRTAYDQKAKIWPHLVDLDKSAMTAAGAELEDMVGEVA